MNRRQFMAVTAAGAAGVTSLAWLHRAFAGDCAIGGRVRELFSAYQRARKARRPLLVFVIPREHDGDLYLRGKAFGEWLNHGSDDQIAPLALCEVACATMAELSELASHVGAGEPLMVHVRTDRVPAPLRFLDAKLPDHPQRRWSENDDADIDRRIDTLARLARSALTPRGPQVGDAAALAREVRERLVHKPPPGARWATSSGCGVTIEGGRDDEQSMVACGMGHVPRRSARFLHFLTS